MPTTLKNGMYVTPPISNEYLTEGSKYIVNKVSNGFCDNIQFKIRNDKNKVITCLLNNCAHINNLNWKIVEL